MANPGVGNKFVSVNLNKSYGQHSHHHSSHSSSYGSSRARPNSHGGGGGGMVVLSRPRSSQKAGPKLSVPPPLNLPSLRKEHERFDSLGSGGGPAGGGVSGTGPRPTSSGMGWTKPATAALQEKEAFGEQTLDGIDQGSRPVDGFSRGSSAYIPPSARSGVVGPSTYVSAQAPPTVEKAAVLKGEDFPSLRATLSSTSGAAQKHKENLNQKQKQLVGDHLSNEQKDGLRMSSLADMDSQLHLSQGSVGNGLSESSNRIHNFSGSRTVNHALKQEEYFPGPLPLVRLNPRSDWADDERDTSHGLTDRNREGRDHGFSKSEAYWDRDIDMPRVSVMPPKPVHNFDKWGQRDDETGKASSGEVTKMDPYIRTASREGREGNSWRNYPFSKDVLGIQDAGNDRNGVSARQSNMNREIGKDNKYIPSPFRDNVHDDSGKREIGYGQGGKQPWNNMESYGSRGPERNARDRYAGSEQHYRYGVDSVQSSVSKSSFSSGGKGLPVNDPLLNFSREKRPLPKSEKAFLEDPLMKDFGVSGFDGRDLFSAGLVGVVKKKKDILKQTDFHDPVRESFEAELERVQRMQEQERQRIIEEQERALELARREEEERLRQVGEQEERQRRLEEEAREAAWRAEQERLEALQKAEERRVAREEEKQRILLEEERRKQAAEQKLLELEERIARREAEAAKGGSNSSAVMDEKISGTFKEKDPSRATDVGDWDDSERMVERIITSASSDSSSVNRPLDVGSRRHFSRDISSSYMDRGKPSNSWRRDVYENGSSSAFHLQDQNSGHHSPRRESSIGGKPFVRKDYYGGAGFMPSRPYYKGGVSEPHLDEYAQVKGQRWNQSGEGSHFNRNTEMDTEFNDNFVERFGDGWTQGRSRGNPFSPCPERPYPNSESDGPYAFGRSRYSVRQPRVLPPPSVTSIQKTYQNGSERPGPSAFPDSEMQYDHAARSESSIPTSYDSGHQVHHGQPEVVGALQENTENENQKADSTTTPRCDSQSSLSVSSPPNSPTHLSHDDLDESGDSPLVSSSGEGKSGPPSGKENELTALPNRAGNENVISSSCAVSMGDDEEWTTENNEQFQEQEEYDEDEDYQEEDEVHEGEDNVDLNQEFEDRHLEGKVLSQMDNLVLGFDEGVQVGMPNEEFERTSKIDDAAFLGQEVSSSTLEERVSFDNACSDSKPIQPDEGPSQVILNSSSVFQEKENATQDLVIQPTNAYSSIASKNLGDVESSNSGASGHLSFPTSVTTTPHSSSGQAVMSNVAATPSQSELPVKLQFGLFSGPSLIPSPVPAIQIGSIQMPLHLHPQVGTPLSHMHPSQPPLFQFGQLRYTSPISQGVVPLVPQSMSFVQPNIPSGFSVNHNTGGPVPVQAGQDNSGGFIKNEVRSHSLDDQPGKQLGLSQGSLPSENAANMAGMKQGQIGVTHDDNNARSATSFQVDELGHQNLVLKNSHTSGSSRESEGRHQTRDVSLQSFSKDKDFVESKSKFPAGARGKRYVYTVKNSGSRSSATAPVPKANRSDSNQFMRRPRRNIRRTEFRVRESSEKRQSSGLVSSDQSVLDNEFNTNGRATGVSMSNGPRKALSNKVVKPTVESASINTVSDNSQEIESVIRAEKVDRKETQSICHSGQSNLKKNLRSEEDVDAPLQSGIIRVFEQPGIEAPSDDDDFIEVRSKRQMINDRREQREKEIKAKSRVAKIPRKPRVTTGLANSSKASAGEISNSSRSDFVSPDGRGMAKIEVSSGYNASIVSQPLAPIGTPPLKIDAQADLRSQTSRSLAVSGSGKSPGPGVLFDDKNKVLDDVQTSLSSWGNVRINQQVMTLTQTQLDEAMKPEQFDSRVSVGDPKNAVSEPSLPTSSILTKDKPFSSAASPINSLLAGEKIQFGAVTSPTVLPPSSHAVSHGIGPPRSSRSDLQISHNLTGSENDCSIFFDKEKHSSESRGHLEDCEAEAEAEAAASAVAVAAISSDEIVGNGLGTCALPVSDAKSFGVTDIDGIASGVARDQQAANQARTEETLSVSLPADLSVETPPISLWPPLPSPQNSSSQILSHFPGGPPSHFPFYEMNPMMGGPVFAFGPHDESASTTQSQSQKSSVSPAGQIGSWQQCHSGVDSFYGPPTGFTGPFITPPGGIPGVQGPPHMVVYNHFAPVGQFGQVGLSFMGAAYIPSGKQPDWKHNPTSSGMGAAEGDMNNLNMTSSQRNPANIPAPIQHLAPGSPLLPMASPLAMFDVSPFQSSAEMPIQARWPHVASSSLSSIPLSMPLQQKAEAHTSQFIHGPSMDQPLSVHRFSTSRTSTPSDGDRNFSTAADVNVNQLPDELGLVDPSSSSVAKASSQSVVNKTSSLGTIVDAAKADIQSVNASSNSNQSASSTFKSQPPQQNNISTLQYDHAPGYNNYQRGSGVSQKNSSGGEWSHRRMGFHGRNHSLGAEKSFSSSKVKQIYVAKQTMGGASTVS
ncbi:hypothetical protein L6164_019917 [Bauhinia variegata]|uniref:Uncharacterized protein n=1 Tax=Bauhinia variegata TaxID=167791 RepID=A0ACB9MTM4_BAUVA|nr:hypothetical protein L6164_019917 [Bauhinia variegata]